MGVVCSEGEPVKDGVCRLLQKSLQVRVVLLSFEGPIILDGKQGMGPRPKETLQKLSLLHRTMHSHRGMPPTSFSHTWL